MAHTFSHIDAGDPRPRVEPTRHVAAAQLTLLHGAEEPVTDHMVTGLASTLPGQSDEIDLTALVERRDPAWGRVFRTYARDLACWAERRVGDDAEDVVSETFRRAFCSIEQFQTDGSLRAWLFGIANHVLLDLQRQQCRHPTHGDAGLAIVPARDDMLEIERGVDFDAAEASMTPAVRRAYDLFYKEDLPIETIAQMTGRSVASIKQSLLRAREHMRQALG